MDARVALPSAEEMAEYQDVVITNYPALEGAWCVMDRLKILTQKSGDESMQNAYYIWWLHDHFAGCVFVFAPSSVVVACAVNAPSSWHDSELATNGKLYEKLSFCTTAVVEQSGKCKPVAFLG